MSESDELRLEGGWQRSVSRVGDVVLRSPGDQSVTVIALLRHLHLAGFAGSPVPVGDGFAEDGREQFVFIDGESPQPRPWPDDAMFRIGSLVRELHDKASTFTPSEPPRWRPWFARRLRGDRPVIGHGDLGPWNILARDGEPVAFIDWDNAGPVDALWELAQVAWLNAQLHDDDVAERNGLGPPAERARQVRLLLDGYGVNSSARAGFVDRMIEFAIRSAREEAIDYRVVPASGSPAEDGFPILWAVTWRARAAAWMIDHRATIETALAD